MSINFQEILKELEYRVEHGIIDLTKEEQVTKLVEILRENGISDANKMAQKARVYFSYLNEAKQSLDKVLNQSFKNPDTGRNVTVASALGYKKNTAAYKQAKGMMSTAGYSEKDIDMVDAGPDDEEKPIKKTNKPEPQQQKPQGKKLSGADYKTDIEKEQPTQSKDPKVVQKLAKEITQKIYGSTGKGPLLQNAPTSDAALKNGFQEGAWWVAPGNAGSNFNENMSDECVKILEKYPDLDEETLAMVIFNKTRGTMLGEQQKDVVIKSKNKINIPPTVSKEEAQLYKNCVIVARSGKKKHDRIKEGISEAQQTLGFGKNVSISSHGGTSRKAETPKNVQTDRDNILSKINASKKCYMRDKGTGKIYEIPKEVLTEWVNGSGGGENAADTVVIATDEKGNLLYDGWSDKKTLGDLQANGTLNNDMVLADQRIDNLIKNGQIDKKDISKAKKIVQDGKDRITTVERGYRTVASLQAKYFLGLPDKQFAALEKSVASDKETSKHYTKYSAIVKNVVTGDGKNDAKSVAIAEQISGVKRKKSKEELQADKYIDDTLQKYGEENVADLAKNEDITPEELKMVKKALDAGKAGRAEYMNDFNTEWLTDKRNQAKIKSTSPLRILNNISITNPDVMSGDERKIIERSATKERDRIKASGEKLPKSLDTQKVLEAMRKEALDLQRDTFKQLDKIAAKTASGKPTTLGNLVAYEEAKDFLHLDKIDLPKDDKDYHQILKRNTQLTMEGIDVTPSTLKDCLGVDNTSDLQDHFVVGFDDERYQKNKEGFITGKVICLYIVDKNGQKREISPKTFRPKQGQTAPTANTVSWSEDMQKCFDSKR
jgi:hypothetical protein